MQQSPAPAVDALRDGPLYSIAMSQLVVDVEDWDRVSAADFMGRITVDLEPLADQSVAVWKSNVATHLLTRPNHDLHAIDATPARRRGGAVLTGRYTQVAGDL